MQKLTMGSLFDGSGGFPLAGLLSDITPVWASEIEPFPIRVTTKRLPFMKHYGDISQMDGGKIEPVDIICFGSPCTDMSVAGRRAGLDGQQSILFYQAIRIIKEMRCATNGKYPRWICWENVPGAYSSNAGQDFKAVLEAVIGIVEPGTQVPMPEKNCWPYSDCYMGDGWSVAYRTLDAQHWGVPQRRKRIFLVGDLTGQCAADVLFKSEGLSGYSAESFRTWQRAAGDAENCIGTAGICLNDQGGQRMDVTHEVTCTLRAEAHHPPLVMEATGFCTEHSSQSRGIGYEEELSPTLRAGVVPAAIALENHPADSRVGFSEGNKVQTLTSRMGTGGNNIPMIMRSYGISSKDSNGMKSANPHVGFYETDTAKTLDANGGNPTCNQGGTAVVECPVYSLTTGSFTQFSENTAPTVLARDYKDPTTVCYGIGRDTFNHSKSSPFAPTIAEELQPTLVAKGPGAIQHGYTVRRLTPTECARLQGFPDWWCENLGTNDPSEEEITFWTEVWETHRRIVGKSTKPKTRNQILKWIRDPHSDAAEYKMWGNGVALPCVYFVLSGIAFYAAKTESNEQEKIWENP